MHSGTFRLKYIFKNDDYYWDLLGENYFILIFPLVNFFFSLCIIQTEVFWKFWVDLLYFQHFIQTFVLTTHLQACVLKALALS